MSRQTIVIIGGSGFIGRALAASYQADGHRVLIVSRDPARARAAGPRFEYITALHHLYDTIRPDVLVNLAGAPIGEGRWTPERKQELLHSRLQSVRALAEWLPRHPHPPRLIIQASAVGYYGCGSAQGWPPCTESSPPQNVFVSQLCRQWEAASQQLQQGSGIPVAVCRFGVVLGKGGGILPQLLKPVRWCAGKIGSGRQPLPWIHISDAVAAIRFLAGQQHSGWHAYNLTAPEPATQLDFARAAAQRLHRPLLFPIPEKPLRLLLGEQADLLLDGQQVLPQALLRQGFRFRFPNIGSALDDLLG
ncbi:TIGR01777 family protein [Eikenella sp. S3360]|uniref:TIGR01777 family protein n=1 Tax=Eikenella glucosivorans TaxID=2766967 RepID=A0ABS0N7W8_9NEIS|nr:TIGR01777 family oxidoreductase [Eikenella glucosivorans]MBH5328403.1 TIGR01777 family protein [Eikenella glucosivorans]